MPSPRINFAQHGKMTNRNIYLKIYQSNMQSAFTIFWKIIVAKIYQKFNRHAVLKFDEIDSTTNEPNMVCEQLLVISSDPSHDRYYTMYCQDKISEYFKSISAKIKVLHDFTEGCST